MSRPRDISKLFSTFTDIATDVELLASVSSSVSSLQSIINYDRLYPFTMVTSNTHPNSPNIGMVIYESDTKKSFIWNGDKWASIGGGALIYSATDPTVSDPTIDAGTGWVSSSTQLIKFWTGSTWVEPELNDYLTKGSASSEYQKYIAYNSASPSTTSAGTLWINSSASTPVMQVYTGSFWHTVGNISQVSASARPTTPAFGTIIYNTTNKSFESYTDQGWYTFFTQAPTISSISVTSGATSANRIDPNFAAIINISGQNFDSPTVVMNAFTVPSSQVSHTSTQITIDTGINVVPPNTYTNFIVTNADGQATSASTSIVVNAEPIFGATSTYSATYATAFSINNGFTDEESNAMTYSLASGSLPPGSTLNSETGVLSGTYSEVYTNAPSVLYSPTIRATDSIGNSTDATLNITVTVPFLFRQIINHSYTAAGYKDNVPWRNVNTINVSTDISTNLGDLLQNSTNYTSGAHNRDRCFIWGTGGVGAFTNTSVFNMRTNSTYAKQSAMDTPVTVGDAATVQQDETAKAWIANGLGSSVVARFNLATETAGTTFGLSFLQNDGTGAGGVFTETAGYFHADSTSMKLVFATETMSSGVRIGFHGQQKSMPTKINVGYAGNEGSYNGGFNLRKWNLTTDSQITTYTKPIGDSGEENMTMGQYHQYMLGMYNAAGQNNRSWRYSYNTDTGYEGGASMQPTGVPGRSSGHCYWRD